MSEPALSLTLLAGDLDLLVDKVATRVLERLEAQALPWLNVTAAAAYLGWPKKRLYNLVAANEIPHRKQGNRLLFNRRELDVWLHRFYEGPSDFRP